MIILLDIREIALTPFSPLHLQQSHGLVVQCDSFNARGMKESKSLIQEKSY